MERASGALVYNSVNLLSGDTTISSIQTKKARNGAVRQLAPVTDDRLNVIGENHPESEARIDREKSYLRQKTGSDGYWDELTFKVGANPMVPARFDKAALGDPTWLHLEHAFRILMDNLEITLNRSRTGGVFPVKDHKDGNLRFWKIWTDNQDIIGRFRQTGLFDLTDDQVNLIRDSRDASTDAAEKMANLTEAVGDKESQPIAIAASAAIPAVRTLALKLYEANAGLPHEKIRPSNVLKDKRDEKMHDAANKEWRRKGAWKIGDAHAATLGAIHYGAGDHDNHYNVTTRAEFNTELPPG